MNGIFTDSTRGLGTDLMVSHGAPHITPFIWCCGTFLSRFPASPFRRQTPHCHSIPSFLAHIRFLSTHRSPQELYNALLSRERIARQSRLKSCPPQEIYSCNTLRSADSSIPLKSCSNKANRSHGLQSMQL